MSDGVEQGGTGMKRPELRRVRRQEGRDSWVRTGEAGRDAHLS